MELTKILRWKQEILDRFSTLDKRIERNKREIEDIQKDVDAQSLSIKTEMNASLDKYLHGQVGTLSEKLKALKKECAKGYEDVLAHAESSREVTGFTPSGTLDECVKTLYKQIDGVNACLDRCNSFDFDKADPPTKITLQDEVITSIVKNVATEERHSGELFETERINPNSGQPEKKTYSCDKASQKKAPDDKKPAKEVLKPLFTAVLCAEKTCAAVDSLFRRGFAVTRFENYVQQKSKQWVADEVEMRANSFSDQKKKLLVAQDDVISEEFFQKISADGDRGKVNPDTGSDEFGEYVTLGTVDLNVYDPKIGSYNDYVTGSPVLGRHLKNGAITMPLVLDLKKCGNVLINVDQTQNYSAAICDLIHTVVQAFMLSFPAGRLNLSFIELNKSCNFSQYTPLKKYFFGPIIRDGQDSDAEIHRLKNAMYDIHDNKISFNRVDNFYEYNKKSRTNPQSAHLLVITDFPSEMSEKAVGEVLDILENGNHTGVFTVLVNNAQVRGGLSDAVYRQFMEKAQKNALVLNVQNDAVHVGGISDANTFTPVEGLGSDFARPLAELLVNASESVKQQVITLKDIWEKYAEDPRCKRSAAIDSSALLDIPIGMRGGEVQTLKLSTTGEGSAHAVVIGGTGSGKSNLLHTIVLSGCYRYSPDEFQIYLVDFKGGVEFKYYEANKVVAKQIPHVRLTGLTSEPEDGLAILRNVRSQLRDRENLFRRTGVEDIMQYNKKAEKRLPRLLVIIDEVQEIFRGTERNNLAQTAIDIMGELFKKGRAFGINLLWASQNVPRVSGIKDEILSQIGNRICLKVNNVDDAEEIGVDAGLVKGLNRPEKGLGVISDSSTSGSSVEFRVAFAESTENRGKISDLINARWADVVKKWSVREPLFVVGNDETPLPTKGMTTFSRPIGKADIRPKSTGAYALEVGQDYITGKPFTVPVELMGTKSNLWMAGASFDELRDMIGYCLLSTVIENVTNADMAGKPASIYYVNCERKALGNENDLYYVMPSLFPDQIKDVSGRTAFIETLRTLYVLNKERSRDMAGDCSPVFLFAHKLQTYGDLFGDTQQIALDKEYTGAAESGGAFGFDSIPSFGADFSSGGGNGMTFAELFREVVSKGADNGIHVVLSVDKPSTLGGSGIKQFTNYILIKGISESDMLDITGSARSETLNKEGMAFCYIKNEFNKFKPYRFDPDEDSGWLNKLAARLKAVR